MYVVLKSAYALKEFLLFSIAYKHGNFLYFSLSIRVIMKSSELVIAITQTAISVVLI